MSSLPRGLIYYTKEQKDILLACGYKPCHECFDAKKVHKIQPYFSVNGVFLGEVCSKCELELKYRETREPKDVGVDLNISKEALNSEIEEENTKDMIKEIKKEKEEEEELKEIPANQEGLFVTDDVLVGADVEEVPYPDSPDWIDTAPRKRKREIEDEIVNKVNIWVRRARGWNSLQVSKFSPNMYEGTLEMARDMAAIDGVTGSLSAAR